MAGTMHFTLRKELERHSILYLAKIKNEINVFINHAQEQTSKQNISTSVFPGLREWMSAPTITFKNMVTCNLLFVIFRQRIPFLQGFVVGLKSYCLGPK